MPEIKKNSYLFFALLLLGCPAIPAQNHFSTIKFDFSARYRFEAWNGMNAKNYGDKSPDGLGNLNDNLVYQRIIAGFTWNPNSSITVSGHMQDSRAYGWSLRNSLQPEVFRTGEKNEGGPSYIMNPGEEFFEIYDVFVEYRQLLKNVTAKLGRQKIFFGDNHIFGPGEWGNTGRWTWDALRLTWKKNSYSADVFAGGTKIHHPHKTYLPFTQTEYFGGGFYGHFQLPANIVAEPFLVFKRQGSAAFIRDQNIKRNWWGARFYSIRDGGLILDGTIVRQFGSENGKPIDGWGFFAKAGYQLQTVWAKPILSIRETYATGGKNSESTIRTFDPVFGASDKYYGWMNIAKWSNLDDREIVLEIFPVNEMWVEMKYNRFYIPEPADFKLLNNMKLLAGENHLGDEFDVFMRWQYNSRWQFVGAFGYFWPGNLQPINNQPANNASWLAFQVLLTL